MRNTVIYPKYLPDACFSQPALGPGEGLGPAGAGELSCPLGPGVAVPSLVPVPDPEAFFFFFPLPPFLPC